jgi:hypothetical protein
MKKIKSISLMICLLSILVLAVNANAALVDNGNGTITDTDRNLMWLQDANYAKTSGYDADGMMTLSTAMTWADTLIFAGYNDWRLPSSLNSDGSGPCVYWNCTDSELGHIFYTELGNTEQLGYNTGSVNVGSFINLPVSHIWTTTTDEYGRILVFDFYGGQQTWHTDPNAGHWAMAVRDITVVPEPISFTLFITGGVLLAGKGYLRRKKKVYKVYEI